MREKFAKRHSRPFRRSGQVLSSRHRKLQGYSHAQRSLASMGVFVSNRHLSLFFCLILRPESWPNVPGQDGTEDHRQHGHGTGEEVRSGHNAGAGSRELSLM